MDLNDLNTEVLKALALINKRLDSIENLNQNTNTKIDKVINYESFCQEVTGGTTSIMKGRMDDGDFDDIEEQVENETRCNCTIL